MEPLVSVLIPAFNTARTLAASLRSLMRQTERNWQCVIVDDGSIDGSLALARRFAALDERYRVVANPHGGIVASLNRGLRECAGRFVARLDADDLMRCDRLRAQAAVLEDQPDLAAVGCHVRMFPRSRLTAGLRAYESWLNTISCPSAVRRDAFIECPVAHPGLMIRGGILRDLGYRDTGWPEDYDLVLRLLATGANIGIVPRRLLLWRDLPNRLWRTSERYSQERFTACKAAFLATGFLEGRDEYALWGYGGTGRRLHRALLRHGKHPARIVELHPGRLGKRIHGAPVIRPEELAALPRLPLLVSVAGSGPRQEIRQFLARKSFAEGEDFICVA